MRGEGCGRGRREGVRDEGRMKRNEGTERKGREVRGEGREEENRVRVSGKGEGMRGEE